LKRSARLRSERRKAGIVSIWCVFDRHDATFKKHYAPPSKIVLTLLPSVLP
jgi:hypothetical protein